MNNAASNNDVVAVFIDGSNLYKALITKYKNFNIDLELLVNKLVGNRKLLRAYYHNALPKQNVDPEGYKKRQKFLHVVERFAYFEVVYGRVEYQEKNGTIIPREKGVDINIAVGMLELAYQKAYDVAILVSGDSDFAKVVNAVKDKGLQVENARVPYQNSRNLDKCCDRVIILNEEFLEGCWR